MKIKFFEKYKILKNYKQNNPKFEKKLNIRIVKTKAGSKLIQSNGFKDDI